MIRIGLIGLGKMGVSHCSILNAHPQVESVAVCDTSTLMLSAIKKYTPMPCYKDYKKLITEFQPDGIIIATPTASHFDIAKFGIDNNCHVFVEKPLCLTPEQSDILTISAKEKNLISQTGYHNRFLGTFQEVKRLLGENILGEIYHYLGEAYGPVVLKEKSDTWRSSSQEGGGCLYDYAAHVINLVNFLIGMPERVQGTVLQSIFSKSVEDAVYSTLIHENNLIGRLSINWSDESYRKMSTQITILGKKGKIIADAQEVKIYLNEANDSAGLEKGWNIKWLTDVTEGVKFYLRGEEYSSQIDAFIKCINDNSTENVNSFENALMTDRVIDMLKKDAQRLENI